MMAHLQDASCLLVMWRFLKNDPGCFKGGMQFSTVQMRPQHVVARWCTRFTGVQTTTWYGSMEVALYCSTSASLSQSWTPFSTLPAFGLSAMPAHCEHNFLFMNHTAESSHPTADVSTPNPEPRPTHCIPPWPLLAQLLGGTWQHTLLHSASQPCAVPNLPKAQNSGLGAAPSVLQDGRTTSTREPSGPWKSPGTQAFVPDIPCSGRSR